MTSRLLRGIRPVDAVLAGVLCVLAAAMAVLDIWFADASTRIDSHSWLQLPVLVAAAVPVLWWRRGVVAVVVASSVVMLVHLLAFDHVVRCGAGLPLAFTVAFLCGVTASGPRTRWTALGLSVVLAALVLVWDTAAGPDILPVVAVIQLGLYGVARVVADRAAMARELGGRNTDLRRLRDERAALEVSDDRAQLSASLETLLETRLAALAAAAERGTGVADPTTAQALLAGLEEDGRATLGDMRGIVGRLRDGDVALGPVPTVGHLDALLARHVGGGSRLRVQGDPRVLPPGVELSVYRIVEHLVGALADAPSTPVAVTVTFADDAMEILVAGSIPRGADLRGAAARARERARLHAGSLEVKVARGQARVLAHLPV